MENIGKYTKASVVVLALFSAVLGLLLLGTGAFSQLGSANLFYFALSALFFIASILVWLFTWALLVTKRTKKPLKGVMALGVCSVFGSLTPIQLGSDALRSIFLKEEYSISISESLSASMIVKGLKFSALAVVSAFIVSGAFLSNAVEPALLLPLLSGLLVVFLASALFLLPLNRRIGHFIAGFFGALSGRVPLAGGLAGFFREYSVYLRELSAGTLLVVFALCGLSWILEFLSLFSAFYSLGIAMPVISLAVLFVLVAVLERTPVLPRGILLVEAAGFAFLSFPLISNASLSVQEIAAVLVLFDLSRLIIPTIASMAFYSVYRKINRKGR